MLLYLRSIFINSMRSKKSRAEKVRKIGEADLKGGREVLSQMKNSLFFPFFCEVVRNL